MKRASHSDAHRLVLVDSDIGSELVVNGMAVNENLFTGCFLSSLFFFPFFLHLLFQLPLPSPECGPLKSSYELGEHCKLSQQESWQSS